jgi:hypothetical protein
VQKDEEKRMAYKLILIVVVANINTICKLQLSKVGRVS